MKCLKVMMQSKGDLGLIPLSCPFFSFNNRDRIGYY